MKIAIICYKGFGADGISAFVLNNYKNIDHSKISCCLVFPKIIGNADVTKNDLTEFEKNGDSFVCITKQKNILVFFHQLVHFLRKNKFDAVHIHGSSASIVLEVLAAKFAGIKKIYTHSHNTTGNHVVVHRFCRVVLNALVTNPLACGIEAGRWMYGKRKFKVVPNGIDLSRYRFNVEKKNQKRNELGISPDTFLIGHVGGFNYQKNHEFLIHFVESLKSQTSRKVMLCLVGRGHTMDSIKQLAKSLNVSENILFLGQRTDVPELMMAMDAFLLPSRFEGFPIVGIEAQASGLPTFMSTTIAREAEITDLVTWLPIDKGPECWCDAVVSFSLTNERERYVDIVAQKGFDVKMSAQMLQSAYLQE